jgi:hypothetical protein
MFGRTRDPLGRVAEHIRAAEVHGWALVDGWLSPGARQAPKFEQAVIRTAGLYHRGLHYRERFFGMDFDFALKIARVMFELWDKPESELTT